MAASRRLALAGGALLGVATLLVWGAAQNTLGLLPLGDCYRWQPSLIALQALSDATIGVGDVAIAATLAYLVYRARSSLPFHWVIVAFGVSVAACGATHLVEVWTLWQPHYWLSGSVKLLTAIVTATTAIALPPLVPRALELLEAQSIAESRRIALAERDDRLAEATRARNEAEELRRIAEEARADADAQRQRAEEALRQMEAANRSKDQFLAMVSHELRNPLSPLLAWARMLRTGRLDEDKQRRAYEVIERSALAQAQLVEDLLDVSRIVSGKLRLEVRPTELAPVVQAALESLRPSADAKNIRLQVVLDPRAGTVAGDPDRLQQVVWNLVSNAIKFTPRGGRVWVALQRVESHVELVVADSGEGVSQDDLPHLFERFWQSERGIRRRHGGLGLGLAIVRHLVELHGGSVSAYSAGLGHGTEFRLEIPIAPLAATAPSDAHPHTSDEDASPYARLDELRILVVDDDPDSNEMLQTLFASCGAEVRVAASARQALEILDRWRPDVLVSDIGMPDVDGFELLAAIRQRPRERGGETPAIALTAFARTEDRIRVLEAGFQMHVPKPVDPSELTAVVQTVVRSTRLRPA